MHMRELSACATTALPAHPAHPANIAHPAHSAHVSGCVSHCEARAHGCAPVPLAPVSDGDADDDDTDDDEPSSPLGQAYAASWPTRPDGQPMSEHEILVAAREDGDDASESDERDLPVSRAARRNRGGRRQGRRGDGAGLAHGRDMHCVHCRNGGLPGARGCMGQAMQEEPSIADIISQHQGMLQMFGSAAPDDDHRAARFSIYGGAVAWQFGTRLGAEQRYKLCDCVEIAIRKLFPCSACGEGCDYSRECERRGHYCGFKSATESRAARSGNVLIDLVDGNAANNVPSPSASTAPGPGPQGQASGGASPVSPSRRRRRRARNQKFWSLCAST